MTSVADMIASAQQRRVPLIVHAVAADSGEATVQLTRECMCEGLAVWHIAVDGTEDFRMLSQASGSTTVPRCHVFPPSARGLAPLVLQGESYTAAKLRDAILLSVALTKDECDGIKGKMRDAGRALALARGRHGEAVKASPKPSPKPTPKPASKVEHVDPVSDATPAPAPPVKTQAPALGKLVVRVTGCDDLQLPLRNNTSLALLRKTVAKKLGDEFVAVTRRDGRHVSHREEERMIVSDVQRDDGSVVVQPSQPYMALRSAKATGASPDTASSSSPTAASPSSPAARKLITIAVTMPPGCSTAQLVHEGEPTEHVAALWPLVSSKLDMPSQFTLVCSNDDDGDGKPAIELTRADAEHGTLNELKHYHDIVVKLAPADCDGEVKLRLQLPRGEPVCMRVAATEPLMSARSRVEAELGHPHFYLVLGYPPRRFGPDDYELTMQQLSLTGGVTLRVLEQQPEDAKPEAGDAQAESSGGTVGNIMGALSSATRATTRLVGGILGGGTQPAADQPAAQPQQRPTQPRPAGSLHELRAREAQEKDKEDKDKPNRYFGGDSTEYEARK